MWKHFKTTTTTLNNTSITVIPNAVNDFIYIRNNQVLLENENVDIMDYTGKIIHSSRLNNEGGISIRLLNNGLYFLKTKFGVIKIIVRKG